MSSIDESSSTLKIARRSKRDKKGTKRSPTRSKSFNANRPKSKSLQKHGNDGPSGGVEALVPSLIGVAILIGAVMARMGFRGRADVAGIDLGTTNSVVCVQVPSKSVGAIECIPDPATGSPIVPSVISILDTPRRKTKQTENFVVPPSQVVVGAEAKRRIDSHPHHTLYNAKRVIGKHVTNDLVDALKSEVEFDLSLQGDQVIFTVPLSYRSPISVQPEQVGAYVVNHLMKMTQQFLGHENVRSAVICVPAKFDGVQRRTTVEAFAQAGIKVLRILEEPTAAALAYGLDKKDDVNYILVYDFGGGTLDVSLLHVSEGGYVEVIGSDGDARLGGADFDAAVAHHLYEHGASEHVGRISKAMHQLEKIYGEDALEEILSSSCQKMNSIPLCTHSSLHTLGEKLKIELSSFPDQERSIEISCLTLPENKTNMIVENVEDFCSALEPTPLSLTTSEYEAACHEFFHRSAIPIRRLLSELSMKREEIDEVVMVGGTTRMPQIRKLVKEELGVSHLNTHIDPDITVAYGAASVID